MTQSRFKVPFSIRILRQSAAASIAICAGVGVASAPFAAITPAVAQASTNQDLSQISRHLKAMSSLRADFIQTDRTGQAISGKLIIKQPGKIRFQYQADAKLLIVSDGRALTMIDYEVNQVQRWPIRNSPLGVLLDTDRDLSKYGKLLPTADPNIVSVEVKDPKRPEYGIITLIFERKSASPGGLEMIGWVALDSQNKRTSIRLSNQRYNVAVDSKEFNWTDPRVRKTPRR